MNGDENLTERELEVATWWVKNRAMVRRVGVGALIAVDVVLGFFAVAGMVKYFLIDYTRDERLLRELQEPLVNPAALVARRAVPLDLRSVTIRTAGANRYDLVAFVNNSNSRWYATFDAVFRTETDIIARVPSFVLPNEEKPLVALGVESVARLRGVRVELHNLMWRPAPLLSDEIAARLKLSVRDTAFAASAGPTEPSRLSFNATNSSAWSYWSVRFIVVLRRGAAIVGTNVAELSELRSGETRSAAVSWFEAIPTPTKIEVYPEVNIFDRGAYIPPGR